MTEELRNAYRAKERADLALSKLERRKAAGKIDQSQYEIVRADYATQSNNAASGIKSIKDEAKKETRQIVKYQEVPFEVARVRRVTTEQNASLWQVFFNHP